MAQFCWPAKQSNFLSNTRAPACLAMAMLRSLLYESSTTTSSLHATDSRQAGKFCSLFKVRMRMDTVMGSPGCHRNHRFGQDGNPSDPLKAHRLEAGLAKQLRQRAKG